MEQNIANKEHKILQKEQLPDPNVQQRRAADPVTSVWVGASAGTGKTKVLVDRVLRLLLPQPGGQAATDPHRILCLTFTKAAASEMALRINQKLGAWAVMPEDDHTDLQGRVAKGLRSVLAELTGQPPQDEDIKAARRLFAQVVDVPGGLKIMTIHSFCQSVLGRFPLKPVCRRIFRRLMKGRRPRCCRRQHAMCSPAPHRKKARFFMRRCIVLPPYKMKTSSGKRSPVLPARGCS